MSDAAVDALLDDGGFDAELGARPMRRAIARLVEAPVAEMILKGELGEGDVALVDVEDGRVAVDAVRSARRHPTADDPPARHVGVAYMAIAESARLSFAPTRPMH